MSFIAKKPDPIRLLCVDDQPIIGEALRKALINAHDIEFHYCQNPLEALDLIKTLQPTVILQDLIMPEVDGLELLKQLRTTQEAAQIPIIVLSGKEDAKIKAQAFALGASDYMVKVPAPEELLARVRYHAHAYITQKERDAFYKNLLMQLKQAANYVRSLLPERQKKPIETDWVFLPSANLGGDAFDYFFVDAEHVVFYLLDVCDHGIGPALLSVSILNLLRSTDVQILKSPQKVLSTLNARFPMETQDGKFFTLWYGVYHLPSRLLTYSCAGHPPALLLTPSGSIERLRTEGIAIGITDTVPFVEAQATLPPGASLYLFSDGVYELFNSLKLLTLRDLEHAILQLFACNPHAPLQRLVTHMQSLQNSPDFEDDFSLLRMIF